MSATYRFAVAFGASTVVFQIAFLTWVAEHSLFERYLEVLALGAARILSAMGMEAHALGSTVQLGGREIRVTSACSGVQPIVLFVIAVAIFPSSIYSALRAALIGTVALVLLNQVRIVSLCYVWIHHPSEFHVLHRSLWPMVMIMSAIGLWSAWAGTTVRAGERRDGT